MAFITKEWKNRLVEFAGRRKLTNVSTGEETIVDVSRNEGTVSQEGDAFSAANMNNLEQRVANEFNNINTNLTNLSNSLIKTISSSGVRSSTDTTKERTQLQGHYNSSGVTIQYLHFPSNTESSFSNSDEKISLICDGKKFNLMGGHNGNSKSIEIADATIKTLTLGATNGTQSWGKIYKCGRICFMAISGYANTNFIDNKAYKIGSAASEYIPINETILKTVQGDWVNDTGTNLIEVTFIKNGSVYDIYLSPIKRSIGSGEYIAFDATYISNS